MLSALLALLQSMRTKSGKACQITEPIKMQLSSLPPFSVSEPGQTLLGPVYTNPDSVVNTLKSIRFGFLLTRILRKQVRNLHHFENANQSELMRISARGNCKSAYVSVLPRDSALDSMHDLERKMELLIVVTILLALIDLYQLHYQFLLWTGVSLS